MSNALKFLQPGRIPNLATIEQKVKGTVWEKWLFFWKAVIKDYRDVAIGLKNEAIQKPKKATTIITGFSLVSLFATTNPNAISFRARHIENSVNLSLVSPAIANPISVEHLKYLERCYNADLIRIQSFGLFSIIWVDTSSDKCKNYESTCNYLQWQYKSFGKQIVDIGFLGNWWVISRKMLDYDINY